MIRSPVARLVTEREIDDNHWAVTRSKGLADFDKAKIGGESVRLSFSTNDSRSRSRLDRGLSTRRVQREVAFALISASFLIT